MKLIKFTHQADYKFILFFENGMNKKFDLKKLIGKYISLEQIKTDWGG